MMRQLLPTTVCVWCWWSFCGRKDTTICDYRPHTIPTNWLTLILNFINYSVWAMQITIRLMMSTFGFYSFSHGCLWHRLLWLLSLYLSHEPSSLGFKNFFALALLTWQTKHRGWGSFFLGYFILSHVWILIGYGCNNGFNSWCQKWDEKIFHSCGSAKIYPTLDCYHSFFY